MSLMLSMSMKYLFSFGVETDYVRFDLNGDLKIIHEKLTLKRVQT